MKRGISLLLVLVSLFLFGVSASYAGTTEMVSVDSAGIQGNSLSDKPSMSSDGRYVAFESWAGNLVPGDTNWRADIFVHDRVAGTTERVSVDSTGVQGLAESLMPSISADGRYVVFESYATNLVPGDTNKVMDIFVHDRVAGTTERVSVDSAGAQANALSGESSISADGRYVAFKSAASNLVAGDTNGGRDIFVRDMVAGTTERVSVDSTGGQANGESGAPFISADGRYVAFLSQASNLVAGDTNVNEDIFVHDRLTGVTERVSVDSTGGQANGNSGLPSISPDGRYVTFWSQASNLVAGDTNGYNDAFVHDRLTDVTERVSVDSTGGQANAASGWTAISADGRYVAFDSQASNLVPGDTNGGFDIFVHDRQTGTTEMASVDNSGTQGNSRSEKPAISADCKYVAFGSWAGNLVPGDTNGTGDVFVRARDVTGGGGGGGGGGGDVSIGGIPDLISSLNIQSGGTANSLISKAENAIRLATVGETNASANMLSALINAIEAQRGKKIDPADADQMIEYINSVIEKMVTGQQF